MAQRLSGIGALLVGPHDDSRDCLEEPSGSKTRWSNASHALEALHDVEVVVTDFAMRDGKEPQNQTWNALAQGLHDHGYAEGE